MAARWVPLEALISPPPICSTCSPALHAPSPRQDLSPHSTARAPPPLLQSSHLQPEAFILLARLIRTAINKVWIYGLNKIFTSESLRLISFIL